MNESSVLRTLLVQRVYLEDPTQIMYQDGNSQYYTTSRKVKVEYPTKVTLHIYKSPLNLGSQYYDNAENEYTKVNLPQFRSPTNNGLPMFGFPRYTNIMGQEDSTFIRDTYTPDRRGMGTKESGGIKVDTELPKPHGTRVDPTARMSDHNDERKHDYDYTQRVRPSMLQKLVKKFDGSGDPYDHIATFRQVVRAEQVSDNHT